MKKFIFSLVLLFFGLETASNQQVKFKLLHMNDVYEITTVEGGKWGGVSRASKLAASIFKWFSGNVRQNDATEFPGVTISEYDIIRVFPFGGKIVATEMRGDFLQKVLQRRLTNRGKGVFLQTARADFRDGKWFTQNSALEKEECYSVAKNDFLLTGKEEGFAFLNDKAEGVQIVEIKTDIRHAFFQYLKKLLEGSVVIFRNAKTAHFIG